MTKLLWIITIGGLLVLFSLFALCDRVFGQGAELGDLEEPALPVVPSEAKLVKISTADAEQALATIADDTATFAPVVKSVTAAKTIMQYGTTLMTRETRPGGVKVERFETEVSKGVTLIYQKAWKPTSLTRTDGSIVYIRPPELNFVTRKGAK